VMLREYSCLYIGQSDLCILPSQLSCSITWVSPRCHFKSHLGAVNSPSPASFGDASFARVTTGITHSIKCRDQSW
jgi:hypothetical protein